MQIISPIVLSLTMFSSTVLAGITSYGICQTRCNDVAVACYKAAGFTFGTVAAPQAPPSILACNSAQGTCAAACAVSYPLSEIASNNTS